MSSEVEEIKDRLSVVELVGEYIRVAKAGSSWKALCPFHNEKTPSFMLSEERRSWHCFGCGKGGDIFSFMMEMEGVDFREALEMLAQKAGVELKKFTRQESDRERVQGNNKKSLYQILEITTKWYEKNLWEGRGKDEILNYLRSRGLQDETIKKFRLGYAPGGWRNLLEFLQKKKFRIEDIAGTGLMVEKDLEIQKPNAEREMPSVKCYDRFRDRIIFPIQDTMGRVVGFSARVTPGGDEKNAKYVNTPQTSLYDKSKILYGLNFAKAEIKRLSEVILVEGNMDVIASCQGGFMNTVAVSGTALTLDQIKTIKRYTDNVKMAFDMDSAGQTAAKKSARICLENDLNVRIVVLPSGKDAADVIRDKENIWQQALENARNLVEYFFEDSFIGYDAQNPTGKKKIARELLNIIKDIADPVEKSHWIKVLAEKLGVGEKVLLEVLRKIVPGRNTVGKSEEIGKKNTERGALISKRILGIALAFPHEALKWIDSVEPDYFSNDLGRRIFSGILREKGDLSLDKIKKGITDYEAQKYMDEAVFEVEVESQRRERFDPSFELKEAIDALCEERVRGKIAKISREIREAEAAGDKKKVSILMRDFQSLSERLRK